ncbi:hypothetical protein [Hymenobacter edaphi]|uniref:Uncharacterized protein n=1 Tax=Hymenobacter edaphi TaxID=2211146 RepID=A0A328BXA9_9BACT|nr:hypothetical protein [Hymenobacter edaphi]RAK69728.1 hypothetical protein DLM85_02415 [Hymenobacter edaphi]
MTPTLPKRQLLLLALCALTLPALAQKAESIAPDNSILDQRAQNEELLFRSLNYAALSYGSPPYADWGAPKAPYILSADIIPQFAIGGKRLPFALHFTPRFKARIFRDDELAGDSSLPVRTPSYMPGATLYFKNNALNAGQPLFYKFASVSVFHHSNGQDGNSLNPDGRFNQYNGSFSTNFAEVAVYLSHKYNYVPEPAFTCDNNLRGHTDFFARLGFEKHFATDVNLIGRYGQNRLNAQVGWIRNGAYRYWLNTRPNPTISECYLLERHRFVASVSVVADTRLPDLNGRMNKLHRRVNAELMYARRLPVSANVAFQASGGYYGTDPYNAYFEDAYFYARLGLAFGFFTSTTYRDTPTR